MQDIQDAEADSVRDLTQFVDAELDYHERCAAELRRLRDNWPARSSTAPSSQSNTRSHSPATDRRPTVRARSSTAVSYTESLSRINTTGSEPAPPWKLALGLPMVGRTGSAAVGDWLWWWVWARVTPGRMTLGMRTGGAGSEPVVLMRDRDSV